MAIKKYLNWLLNIWVLALLAGAVTFVVYLPALENGFVSWDDDVYLYKNDHIMHLNGEFFRWAFTEFRASNWHPLTWFSHAIDYAIWGLNPRGHHLTSVLLHSINTLLVTLLAYQLLSGLRWSKQDTALTERSLAYAALVTGLLFGLHPLHVESVAWIAERKDLLCAFFYLLSLAAYLRWWRFFDHQNSSSGTSLRVSYLLCLGLFAFALMSKPMAVSLPFALLLIDWIYGEKLGRKDWRFMLAAKVPFFLLALASVIITLVAQKSGGAIDTLEAAPLTERIWVAFHALTAYLQKMVWPVSLQPFYIYPVSVDWLTLPYLGSALLVVAVTLTAVFKARRRRAWSAAWGYYIVTLLPVIGIVKVGGQAMADRYTYLPSIAPFIVLAAVLAWALWSQPLQKLPALMRGLLSAAVAVLLVAVLGPVTQRQIGIWKDGETLWRYQIEHNDKVPLAYKQLGVALFERAEYLEAAKMMSKALSLKPRNADLLSNLAICHLELGNLDKATQAVESALRIEPNNLRALNTLGEIHLARQEFTEANRIFFRAMQLEPNNPLRLFNLAVSFDKLGDAQQSCIYWRRFMDVDVSEKYDTEIIPHLAELGCPLSEF